MQVVSSGICLIILVIAAPCKVCMWTVKQTVERHGGNSTHSQGFQEDGIL